ncbi:MAG: acyltransferase [Gammaproteobacteria bacterium]
MRGLAAIAVMLYHYTTRYDELYAHPAGLPFRVGEGSVILVFIISGFAITLSLLKRPYFAAFLVARAGRLLPAYWVAVLLTHAVVSTCGLPGREVGLEATVANLTMLQHFIGVADVDGAYWTLAVQMVFYALTSLLLITGQFRNRERFCAVWLTVLFAGAGMAKLGHPLPSALKTALMLDFGNLFIAGIMFCSVRIGAGTRAGTAIIVGCLMFDYLFHDTTAFRLSLVFFGTLWLLSTRRLEWLAAKPLDFLGSISYTLYLLHQDIGYVVMREAYRRGVASPVEAMALAVAVSMGLATLVSAVVERPAMRGARKAWALMEAPLWVPPFALQPFFRR